MLEYIFKNIFWNPSPIKYSVLLGVSVFLCLILYLVLQIIHKSTILTFDEYIPIEQAAVSLMAAIWTFGLFCLPIALVLWITFYFVYSKAEKTNRAIKYVLANPSKFYYPLMMEKNFKAMPHKSLLKEILLEKKKVREIFDNKYKSAKLPKKNLPIRLYLSGLIFYSVLALVEQKTIASSGIVGLVYFNNVVVFLGLFYVGYIVKYLIDVKDWRGSAYGLSRLFDIVTVLYAITGVVVVIAITYYFLH